MARKGIAILFFSFSNHLRKNYNTEHCLNWTVLGYKFGLDKKGSSKCTLVTPESKTWDVTVLGEECATKRENVSIQSKISKE